MVVADEVNLKENEEKSEVNKNENSDTQLFTVESILYLIIFTLI